jgi:hypothetical protein
MQTPLKQQPPGQVTRSQTACLQLPDAQDSSFLQATHSAPPFPQAAELLPGKQTFW